MGRKHCILPKASSASKASTRDLVNIRIHVVEVDVPGQAAKMIIQWHVTDPNGRKFYLLLSLTQLASAGIIHAEQGHDAVHNLQSNVNIEITLRRAVAYQEPEVLIF
jgi:hypothetical protein